MNLIHRHVFVSVALACAAAVGLFAFVLVIGNVLKDLMGYIIAGQLAIGTVVKLIALMIPVVVSYALPMGMLTGILLVLGRMSSDHEVTALRASGLSVAWLSAPIIFCALLAVGLNLAVNFEFMPVAKVAYESELATAVRKNPLSFIVPKTFIRDFPGMVIYAGAKDGTGLKDFWIWELDGANRVKRFARADSGEVVFNEKENKLILTLRHVQTELRDSKDPEDFSQARGAATMDEVPLELSLGGVTGKHLVNTKLKWLTFSQLMARWREFDQPGSKLSSADRANQQMRIQVTIHEKFATAFSVLSFALVAIPLGIKVSRKETSANLGLGLALTMVYYFGTIVIGWADTQAAWRPDLLIWLPNFVFQGLGLWMFYRLDRR